MVLGLIYFHFNLKCVLQFLIDDNDIPSTLEPFFIFLKKTVISFNHIDFTSKQIHYP